MKGMFFAATISDGGRKLLRVRSRCRDRGRASLANWTCDIIMDEYGSISRTPIVVSQATLLKGDRIEALTSWSAFRIYSGRMEVMTTTIGSDGMTKCCGAATTFHDHTECCKACWLAVIR